jgi:hypothetical protein
MFILLINSGYFTPILFFLVIQSILVKNKNK